MRKLAARFNKGEGKFHGDRHIASDRIEGLMRMRGANVFGGSKAGGIGSPHSKVYAHDGGKGTLIGPNTPLSTSGVSETERVIGKKTADTLRTRTRLKVNRKKQEEAGWGPAPEGIS